MEIVDYKCVYFTFGRFQPPTKGHAENFEAVKRKAGKCDWYIYLSQTVDNKGSNPLPPNRKENWAKKMFPHLSKQIRRGPRDPTAVLKDLQTQGYDDVVMVVGSDRVNAMQWIKKYNGKEFIFRKMDIISSGERDADGDTFAISGTKMRAAAKVGDFQSFREGMPKALSPSEAKKFMEELADLL